MIQYSGTNGYSGAINLVYNPTGAPSPRNYLGDININGSLTSSKRGIVLNGFVANSIDIGSTGSVTADNGLGIMLSDSAGVTTNIVNNGTINASSYAVSIGGGGAITSSFVGGDIINNSTITSSYGVAINVDGSVTGAITNNATGTLNGAVIVGGTVTGGISNLGTINKGNNPNGYAVSVTGNVPGGITNGSTGIINGIVNADTTNSLTLDNSGQINGAVTFNATPGIINLNGTSGAISGAVTGSATTVSTVGNFSTQNTFIVQSFNVNSGADLTLNNDVTLVSGNTFTNAGNVTVTPTNSPTITGNYSQSGTYTFGVTSPSSYSVLNVSGNATFSGGYGFSLLNSSTLLANNLYRGVLRSNAISGFSTQTYTQTLGGVSYTYKILQDPTNAGWLDLCYGDCNTSTISSSNTLNSVQMNAGGLATMYNQQVAAYQAALSYDCQVYDKDNLCVSVGGRYTYASPSAANAQAGLVILGYRPTPTVRVGVFADQTVNVTAPNGFKQTNNTPMWGLFARWNMNKDGNGLGVQASAVNSASSLNVTRSQLANTEAGSGTTQFNGQGYQLSTSYTQPLTDATSVVPYLGLRYTQVTAGAYTENTSSTVTAPLSYNAMAQNNFSAIGGIGIRSLLAEKLTGTASIGIQQSLKYSIANYQGISSISGLENFSVQMPGATNSMATASAGLAYDITKAERVAVKVLWQQQPFIATNTTTALATYTIGF